MVIVVHAALIAKLIVLLSVQRGVGTPCLLPSESAPVGPTYSLFLTLVLRICGFTNVYKSKTKQ